MNPSERHLKPVTVSVSDAKTRLSRLLDAVEAGEEVVITRNGRPVARLVSALPTPRRRFGTMPGVATVRDGFDEPLSIEELDLAARSGCLSLRTPPSERRDRRC